MAASAERNTSVRDALRELDPHLFERLQESITEDTLYRYLEPISNAHAPFQTARWTRGRVIEGLLDDDGLLERENVSFYRDFQRTGNTMLALGKEERAKDVWLLAHLDMVSYLVEASVDDRYELMPICYHLVEAGSRPAVALAYSLQAQGYETIAMGQLISSGPNDTPYFLPDEPVRLTRGTRITFHSELTWKRDTGELRGSLDDAAGAAALLVAARFLADYDVEVMLALTDEEEGKAGLGSQSICRGGARLLRYFEQPELVIASDIHEAAEMYGGEGPVHFQPGDGASFTERAAHGVGSVVPPHLYALQRQMAEEFQEVGIRLCENIGGYVSRTESVNAMLRTPNIALIGFLGVNRHFQRDVESANIKDLVDLARVVAAYVLFTKTPLWQKVNGRS